MIKYSLRKILKKTGLSSKNIVRAFKAHAQTNPPENRFDPSYKYYYMDFDGDSFISNPFGLLNESFRWKSSELAEYICLASFRNYAEYKLYDTKTLNLFHSPVKEETIRNNRLLQIKDDKIHFYYEEQPAKRKLLWD